MTKKHNNAISTRHWNAGQSWHYETTCIHGSRRVRVHICRNAYDDQSWARGYVFDGDKWNVVVDKPIGFCACRVVSYVNKNGQIDKFEADAADILAELVAILS